jgi:hypothetical protein
MTRACSAILTAVGVPPEKVEAASKVMAGALVLLAPALLFADASLAGSLTGGIAELAGANATQVAIVAGVFTMAATIATRHHGCPDRD